MSQYSSNPDADDTTTVVPTIPKTAEPFHTDQILTRGYTANPAPQASRKKNDKKSENHINNPDILTTRTFHTSVNITKTYVNPSTTAEESCSFTVRLGDAVAVIVEDNVYCSRWVDDTTPGQPPVVVHGHFIDQDHKALGDDVWDPAEVVAIWEETSHAKTASKKSKKKQRKTISPVEVFVEVRWIYRKSEVKAPLPVPSSNDKKTRSSPPSFIVSKVYETDHVDVIPCESITSPIHLLPTAHPDTSPDRTAPTYGCDELYATDRKSLIPITTSADARIKRGRVYSAVLTDAPVRASLEALSKPESPLLRSPLTSSMGSSPP